MTRNCQVSTEPGYRVPCNAPALYEASGDGWCIDVCGPCGRELERDGCRVTVPESEDADA